MQRVAVFGATGSIGTSALDVIARHPDTMRASVLAAGSKVDALVALCRTHRPDHAVIADSAGFAALRDGLRDAGLDTQAHAGDAAFDALAAGDACDSVVAAIVGAAGLSSTLAAARAGKRLLLANKESLVLAGELLMQAAHAAGATIVPIDSEHNAVFQCIAGCDAPSAVSRITLTASGGPFRGRNRAELADVTPARSCRLRPRNGPPDAVSVIRATSAGARLAARHWNTALCSLSIGTMRAPPSRAACISSSPASTSDSLLASSRRLPARAAARVEDNPAAPTIAATTLSQASPATSASSAASPACASVGRLASRRPSRSTR